MQEDQHHAQVVAGVEEVGIDGNRRLKMRLGLRVIAHGAFHNPVQIENLRVVRTLRQQLGAHRPGKVDVVGQHQNAKQLHLRLLVAGVLLNGLLEQVDGILVAKLLDQDHRHCTGQGHGTGR